MPTDAVPEWLKTAVIMQPWGDEGGEDYYVREYARYAARLEELGFNTIILIPPKGHNDISKRHYTEAEFAAAVKGYQQAGIKVLIYSCLFHVGHDPLWHQLVKDHPEWLFRDVRNEPVPFAGNKALCSNNEDFFQITLDYTAGLVASYAPDGIMMDNNFIPGDRSCRCAACQQKFKEHMAGKYTPEQIRKRFRVEPDALTIPDKRSPLFEEWIQWRYRVVHEWTERTRDRLKGIAPTLAFLCNTGYGSWHGATEEQFDVQDAIFCETGGASAGLAVQSKFAFALGHGKPMWFYLATWREITFPMELLPPPQVESMIAATLGHGANAWIVAYGLDIFGAAPLVPSMAKHFRFYAQHSQYFRDGHSMARVALFYSRQTRDHSPLYHPTKADEYRWYNYAYLFNKYAQFMLEQHVPFDILIEKDVEDAEKLTQYQTILAHDASCLSQVQAQRLREFVAAGGSLLTTDAIGSLDELGQRRRRPPFKSDLSLFDGKKSTDIAVGKGRICLLPFLAAGTGDSFRRGFCFTNFLAEADQLAARLQAPRVLTLSNCPPAVEINPTRQQVNGRTRLVLHALNHGGAGCYKDLGVRLALPADFHAASVSLLSPDGEGTATPLPFRQAANEITITLPELRLCAVVVIA